MRRTRVGEIQDRFWQRVAKGGPDDCWVWTGGRDAHGYGTIGGSLFGVRYVPLGAHMLAHRASFIIHNGPPVGPSNDWHGWVVLHTCDNPACVNPAHLRLGTQAENVRDMDKKGRRKVSVKAGVEHPRAVLSEDQVRQIMDSPLTNKKLSSEIGVPAWLIQNVRLGRSYTSITGGVQLSRGRPKRVGQEIHNAALTYEQVKLIRTSDLSTYEIAKQIGVAASCVARARRGETYADVDVPIPVRRVGRTRKPVG